MSGIKGVILGVENVICQRGVVVPEVFQEVNKLITFFKKKGIDFVIHTNRNWYHVENQKKENLKNYLTNMWGNFDYFCYAEDFNLAPKPQAASTANILRQKSWKATETLYIGASDSDMRTAVNGNILFLRATWWNNSTDYGFEFATPKDIARFIDTFCLRNHLWCHEIHDGNFNFYALAPFSTMKPEYTLYSEDARSAAKNGLGHPDFWIGAIVSSLYFSGIHNQIDYVTVYPGHKVGYGNRVMNEAISIFGKCFRKKYLEDLIIRHTESKKSQTARNSGIPIDHLNQLNTIHLNEYPKKSNTEHYKKSPLGVGKTILVIDDITTMGYSLEAARAYIEKTGASVILTSWLKTINRDIQRLKPLPEFNPYVANTFTNAEIEKTYGYRQNITNILAPDELTTIFKKFKDWDWGS